MPQKGNNSHIFVTGESDFTGYLIYFFILNISFIKNIFIRKLFKFIGIN